MKNFEIKKMRLTCTLLLFFLFGMSANAQSWQQVWIDDFNGTNIDLSNWNIEVNAFGGYNNELQYYTDRNQNIRIENGELIIEAHKETYSAAGDTRNYTSARINSKGKRSWKYGRMEAKLKLPYGNGMWPAFWMMGNSGDWPACGEIDIMELVGGNACSDCADNKTHGYIHWLDGTNKSAGSALAPLITGKYSDAYHIFAVEWNTDTIKWLIDDVVKHYELVKDNGQSEFDQPFYFLLNLAVGGNWPGSPDATTVFPQRMYIDYVRVLQKTIITGAGDAKYPLSRVEEKAILYPNPVDNILYIKIPAEFKDSKVSLIDIAGREFLFQKIDEDAYDVSTLPPGLYLLSLTKNQRRLASKFIKK